MEYTAQNKRATLLVANGLRKLTQENVMDKLKADQYCKQDTSLYWGSGVKSLALPLFKGREFYNG
jgi:hypothetical protein